MLDECISLLRKVISVPSFSREEDVVAGIWHNWLLEHGAAPQRFRNNVWAVAPGFDSGRPTLLLNSHMDTVRPVASYTRNPFSPDSENGRLYGLGSNDAGASGVALASSFLLLRDDPGLNVNLVFAITAEEECMGENGMRAFLPFLEEKGLKPDLAIVGEPTCMQAAVAERGLVVLDCKASGKAGHAARNEGVNAIYRAMSDISRLVAFSPERVSPVLGPVKVSVTMINAGTQHNVVPDTCSYTADVRTTDAYTNEETVELMRSIVEHSELKPRSIRIQASVIGETHPLTMSAKRLGCNLFVSPTTSDMALMHGIPSLKIGPGDSSRSHTADEFVETGEIAEALEIYPSLIKGIEF